jgi:hypothetical protein
VRANLPDFVATPTGVIRAIPLTMLTAISGSTLRKRLAQSSSIAIG